MKKFITFFLTISTIYNTQAQCTELFFSEYIEGSSLNKAFEIYNPTNTAIDLTDYVVYRNNNGSSTPTDSLLPQGQLLSKATFTVADPSAIAAILAVKDTTHSITIYNGDDALWLKKISTSDTLDIIGEIGLDPGNGWVVSTGNTRNFTLVRQQAIQKGQKNWTIGATEWDVFPIDMVDSLATHTMTPCAASLGVSENNIIESIDVYPNPTNGNINISLNKTYRTIKINIFDINGRKVFNRNYTNQKNINFTINHNNGLYFIEAIIDRKRIITKLMLK